MVRMTNVVTFSGNISKVNSGRSTLIRDAQVSTATGVCSVSVSCNKKSFSATALRLANFRVISKTGRTRR